MKYLLPIVIVLFAGCKGNTVKEELPDINKLAERYVRLGLSIGQYDGDFVDAYYGPDSLKPQTIPLASFPKDSLLAEITTLSNELQALSLQSQDSSVNMRVRWLGQQLIAFNRRVRIFAGETDSFDTESKELFGVVAPVFPESHFQQLLKELDSLLPGEGNLNTRYQQLANRFIIPVNKQEPVFKEAIAEARKRTLAHYTLPGTENFTMEFVKDKPWSGYNWYKGQYKSLIQINTDLPIFIERAIDLACHEGYPGHHVYNMLLEKNLYRDKGWVEISLYPLFSPQSLIAEGSANYGIEVAFPGEDQLVFANKILLPKAGLDSTGISGYFAALRLKGKLNYARNEVARGLINGNMSEPEAVRWLKEYNLFTDTAALKSISFIRKYRSYVINYNYGLDLVKEYVERQAGGAMSESKRWEIFRYLLSNPVTTKDLQKP